MVVCVVSLWSRLLFGSYYRHSVVWTVLWFFKGIERIISNSNKVRIIEIEGHVDIKAIQPLNDVLTDYSLSIKSIDILEIANTTKQRIVIKLGAAIKKLTWFHFQLE